MRQTRSIILVILFTLANSLCGAAQDSVPFSINGWQLHESDEGRINRMIDLAAEHGVNHLQLSHGIIMNIEDISSNPERAALIQRVAERAANKGISTFVWSHEFNTDELLVCLDPESRQGRAFWKTRQDAYRESLALVPAVSGVILSFGSSRPDPWALMCSCAWCAKHDHADRVALIVDKIGDVVIKEFGMTLFARTFTHTPQELDWMGQALRRIPPRPGLAVMTKDVPQDWEPFYPHNPLIGNVGGHPQIIEMDLAGEYWGLSRILVDLTEYLQMRMKHARDQGAAGFVIRIERGGNSLIGTPGEINLAAYDDFFKSPDADPDMVRMEYIRKRYGVPPVSEDAKHLLNIHKLSFGAAMKMYYVLGFWALEKGSDLTDSAAFPSLLRSRSIALYDSSYQSMFEALDNPDEQTFKNIILEKDDAVALAVRMLEEFKMIRDIEAGDRAMLQTALENQVRAAQVWRLANGALWAAYMFESTHNSDHREWAMDFAAELERYAATLPADQFPGGPDRVASFLENFHAALKGSPGTPEMEFEPQKN